jgi:hypothetical protein
MESAHLIKETPCPAAIYAEADREWTGDLFSMLSGATSWREGDTITGTMNPPFSMALTVE